MKVTTSDIARAAGVSQATVSIVLNQNHKVSISQETRELVLKTAEELGYRFKKREKKQTDTPVIGLLVPTLSNLYYPCLCQNVEIYAKTLGISLVMQNTMRNEEGERQAFQYFKKIGVQGVLCLFTPKVPIPKGMDVVIVGEPLPGVEVDTVGLSNYAAAQIVAEHLLSLGHKDIAYISTPFTNVTDARRVRMEGIRDTMKKAGLADRLQIFVDENEDDAIGSTYEFDCGVRLTEAVLDRNPRCTAIIAVNDMTAYGAIHLLNKRDIKIPEEMAICGFDNLLLDRATQPELTSVDQMALHGCKIGLSVLMEKIQNVSPREEMVLMEYKPKLHIRGTTVKE